MTMVSVHELRCVSVRVVARMVCVCGLVVLCDCGRAVCGGCAVWRIVCLQCVVVCLQCVCGVLCVSDVFVVAVVLVFMGC